jgi:hypothetical protein
VAPANDGFRFFLELAMLASLAYWGFHSHDGAVEWILGLGAPLLVAVAWGVFVSPKAAIRVTDPLRLPLELLLFGAGVAALAAAGSEGLAIVFGALVAIHLVLTFPLGQRA